VHILLDVLIPRFLTEDVAIIENDDGEYIVLCVVEDLQPTDNYDKIVSISCFNLFGFALFPRINEEN